MIIKNHIENILQKVEQQPRPFIAVVGPTCTGKTDVSLGVAKALDIPIVNCDSRLIYAEMNIGTAKPNKYELEECKHYLVDIRDPSERYSAAEYREDFDEVIKELKNKNNIDSNIPENHKPIAVVVGGTGLYIRSALDNLNMPEVSNDPKLRTKLNEQSLEELAKDLQHLDQDAYLQVDMNNKIRVIRAIEIITQTQKPLAESRSKSTENRYSTNYFGINFHKRRALYDLINRRVIKMVDRGLVHEVEALLKKYGKTDILSSTIGYKEIVDYLEGDDSLSSAIRVIQKRTRQYAKKQMTWFKQNQNINWLYNDPENA